MRPETSRPRHRAHRLSRTAAVLAALALGGACALFQSEADLAPSPTLTVLASTTVPPPDTTNTRPPPTTTTSLPATTTTRGSTTTAAAPLASLRYLEQLLSAQAGIAELVESVITINDDWDDRSRSRVSFSETEAALEAAVERASALRDAFASIEPPPGAGLGEQHRSADSAMNIIADTTSEMLDGLRSTDTGQARRAAAVGLLTAYDLLREVIGRVAAVNGEEGEARLAAAPTFTPPPVTSVPETTSTTAGAGIPPNPGNTRNCSDFSTQAEAQEWFDLYFPHYGDVAILDSNQNGAPCEQLP